MHSFFFCLRSKETVRDAAGEFFTNYFFCVCVCVILSNLHSTLRTSATEREKLSEHAEFYLCDKAQFLSYIKKRRRKEVNGFFCCFLRRNRYYHCSH